MRTTVAVATLATALVAGGHRGAAQSGPPVFASRTELVVLHVTVRDSRGGYVTGLPQSAFSILESGRPQAIQFFSAEDAPVTVGLIVDNSGSMQANRSRIVAAIRAFAESSNPADELFALAFNDKVVAALPDDEPFTTDVPTLTSRLNSVLTTWGRTALFDAISSGLDYLSRGTYERKVLVAVSDGGDNASHTSFAEVVKKTHASNALIYTIVLIDEVEGGRNPKLLKQIAAATGGESFAPDSIDDVAGVLKRIALDIRHTYTLGYVSDDPSRDGVFRGIRVVARASDGRRVSVRTRAGYMVPRPVGDDDDGR
jgi:VWFA-related protein